jgi:LmbE family N-acetylglucosaminyl deacetylase
MTVASVGNGARFAAQPVACGGTPTGTWLGWRREWPDLDLDACPGLVLVAPHPDDETLGFGASAATLRARGVDVLVVSVSDGGGGYPDLSPLERTWLERDRRAELRNATRLLGLPEPIHLGLPDGRLDAHEAELTAFLTDLLVSDPNDPWCAATWSGDGHPDHEAVGRAAVHAAQRAGTVVLEYPVWMWHWAQPDDVDVPWHRMVTVPLDRGALARKRCAAKAFATQLNPYVPGVEPVLPPFVVQRLMAMGEVAFR